MMQVMVVPENYPPSPTEDSWLLATLSDVWSGIYRRVNSLYYYTSTLLMFG